MEKCFTRFTSDFIAVVVVAVSSFMAYNNTGSCHMAISYDRTTKPNAISVFLLLLCYFFFFLLLLVLIQTKRKKIMCTDHVYVPSSCGLFFLSFSANLNEIENNQQNSVQIYAKREVAFTTIWLYTHERQNTWFRSFCLTAHRLGLFATDSISVTHTNKHTHTHARSKWKYQYVIATHM